MLLMLIVSASLWAVPTQLLAQCNGTFQVVATYDADGNQIETNYSDSIISVVSTTLFGRSAGIFTWNPDFKTWDVEEIPFKYSGYKDPWYVYRCDVEAKGTHWLYLHEDGDIVLLKPFYCNGAYSEYKKRYSNTHTTIL